MELAEPSLVEVLEDCAMKTTEIVIVLPLFISAGRHVTNDLPAVIRKTAARYPHVCYKLMPHFGRLRGHLWSLEKGGTINVVSAVGATKRAGQLM